MASQQHHSRASASACASVWPINSNMARVNLQSLNMRKQEWQRFFSSCDTRFSPQVSWATNWVHSAALMRTLLVSVLSQYWYVLRKQVPFLRFPTGHIKNQEPVPKDSDLDGNGLHVFPSKVTRGFVGVVCSLAILSLLTFQEHWRHSFKM